MSGYPDFLGCGPAYPFQLSLGPGDMASGEALVEMSMDQILGTALGERLMRPDFGSRLPYLLFENVDEVLEALAAMYVEDALERWEPRIEVLAVDAVADENQLHLTVHYRIVASNNERNRVYVYNRQQGGA